MSYKRRTIRRSRQCSWDADGTRRPDPCPRHTRPQQDRGQGRAPQTNAVRDRDSPLPIGSTIHARHGRAGLDEEKVINRINPKKDVDAFHPVNVGKIMIGNYDFVPCTPAGVMELIKESGIDISGKECVIVGRSNIVGKPMSMLLLHQNGTVTVCHSRTKDLKEVTKRADILVVAVGIPEFITGDMIKEGAVVIDVGINRLENKKLVGDVEFESAEKVASAITPVPGGVGPMTIAMLMKNTLKAAIVNKEN